MNFYMIFYIFTSLCIPFCIFLVLLNTLNTSDILKNNEAKSNRHKSIIYNSFSMDDVVNQQKEAVEEELSNYKFPPNTQLEDFSLSNGGQPKRNIIIASWRTGSTFLGQLVSSVPGSFYFYEPLIHYGPYEVVEPPQTNASLEMVKKLINCNYSGLHEYIENSKLHQIKFSHNTRLWKQCQLYPNYCFRHKFFSDICKVFPFQTMKIIRWRLNTAEELLKDHK